MINLFEYQNKVDIQASFDGLEGFLDEIWNSREKNSFYSENGNDKIESQRFLQFIHKSNELKSNKYVGVIHYEGSKINLLPKIFYDSEKDYSTNEVNQIQNHILWWLSYCRKIKFPNYQASLGSAKSDFFEVLIYLFSKYTRELLNSSIYQQYEEVNRELSFIKGRLNTSEYINENLSKGKWHKLNCTYDAFVFDNEFNRIIKYVVTLLFNVTSSQDNKKNLREILFILDEVSDERATAEQCSRISFNPMFGEFETVRDYCQLFLNNCISFDYKNDLKLFAFLLPMEYVFEDFIFGFIDKELEVVTAKSQRSDTYLDEGKAFNLKPDLWLKTIDKSLIADTKYKIVYSDEKDPKKGISQNDLYQMLAYAVRFEVDEIILFYPNTIKQGQEEETELTIKDALADGKEISIRAFQLPIINRALLEMDLVTNTDLSELFESTRLDLINKIEKILMPTMYIAH
ncbi:McrC family protein [Winogradskyella wichelsiae]|uniref:McrC family protein n=1 Tax=Winogradskyella wichelsiae TaxID=2697007 RepID=UPI003EF723C2